jgi:tetratricopeptide (TPR) repeat protein
MPIRLDTTLKKIGSIPNAINSSLLMEFYNYLNSNGVSESHISNNLKALTSFARFILYGFGRYTEAIECYDKALAINPKQDNALFNKGNALDRLEKYDEAIECYDKAIE